MTDGNISPETRRTPKTPGLSEEERVDLESILVQSQHTLCRTRWTVAVSMLTIGAICCIINWFLTDLYLRNHLSERKQLPHIYLVIGSIAQVGQLTLLCLAPLPDAMRLSRCVLMLQLLCAILTVVVYFRWAPILFRVYCAHSTANSCFHAKYYASCHFFVIFSYFVLLLLALRSKIVATLQSRMWSSMIFYIVAAATINAVETIRHAVMMHALSPCLWHAFMKYAASYICCRYNARQRAQSWLMQTFGAVGDSAAAAAAIAGLLGTTTPHEALAQASSRFRYLSLANLSFEDFRSSPLHGTRHELYAQTKPVLHGTCDAFISHSWHDSPEIKWAALQRWRSEFVAKWGREPRVWLDKCCVDQENIEVDLRCLPIFLSGCRELVVLCGVTYATRLWCMMELFTFSYMKGALDRVLFIKLVSEGQEENDTADIESALESLNVHDCKCSKQEDKDKMLAIIYAAFGDVHCFNENIRTLVRESLSRSFP